MNISEVARRFGVSADTLRYYERVGAIPPVHRSKSGIRSFTDEDLGWVSMAVCLRNAGLPVESLAEYVRLFRAGDHTMQARLDLLVEARHAIRAERERYDAALRQLDYKILRYEEAVRTGVLDWGRPQDDDARPDAQGAV
ncbi:MerR family transcriptional regulator [Berryella wangjianweii]|uniref:MerR family transcriptional regulator n=1 Tax=Berryella wangjianweii TaxID=2734634 RepID=A0A6M8J555_9ACTN|nr:MerR family transcriptional regulator [Berryella wangjianweii]QKF07086.1 MerR family transcriptional regulator [Berryella wangjianweii]